MGVDQKVAGASFMSGSESVCEVKCVYVGGGGGGLPFKTGMEVGMVSFLKTYSKLNIWLQSNCYAC